MNALSVRIRSVALRRWLRSAERRHGNFVVSGYPKSGTTWATQLMARLADVQYEQRKPRLRTKGMALHTHSVNFQGKSDILYVVRDPRESVCSAARAAKVKSFSNVFAEDGTIIDSFVRHAITELPGALGPMRAHLQVAIDAEWNFVRFEDLKANAQSELERLNAAYGFGKSPQFIAQTIAEFDFEIQRAKNRDSVFLAQSSLTSWKTLLSPAALNLLKAEVGAQAAAFGYEL